MVAGVISGKPIVVAMAAALFAMITIAGGWRANIAIGALPPERITPLAAPIAARRNARLIALVYGWGGGSMLSCYYLTTLNWYHAWQYGCGMLLIGLAIYLYSALLGHDGSPAREPRWLLAAQKLTLIHGFAAVAGVLFILSSGKLWTGKPDWAANFIFIASGFAVAALSAISVLTLRGLMRQKM